MAFGWDDAAMAAASYFGTVSTNKSAAKLQQRQLDWNAQMAATAHQREVADLRAAGLNPILSAGGNGSIPSSVNPPPVLNAAETAVNSARASARVRAEIDNMTAQNSNLKAQNKQIESQTSLNKAATASQMADANLKSATAKNVMTQNAILDSQSNVRKMESDWSTSRAGKFFHAIDSMVKSISPFGSSAKSISEIPK